MSAPAEAAAAAVAMELGGTRRVMNPTQSPIESFLLVLFQFLCVVVSCVHYPQDPRVCASFVFLGYVKIM